MMNKAEKITQDNYNLMYEALMEKPYKNKERIVSSSLNVFSKFTLLTKYSNYLNVSAYLSSFKLKDNETIWVISIQEPSYKYWVVILQEDLL